MMSEGMKLEEVEFEMDWIARGSWVDRMTGRPGKQQDMEWVEKMVKEEWAREVEAGSIEHRRR